MKKNKRCLLWLRHKIIYIRGYGYRCKYCGKPVAKLRKKGELANEMG